MGFGGWLLYWRKDFGDELYGVFLVSRITMIPMMTGSSIIWGPVLFKIIRERGLGRPLPEGTCYRIKFHIPVQISANPALSAGLY